MFGCPRCRQGLTAVRGRGQVIWRCERCRGRAVLLPVLRRHAAEGFVPSLWARARAPDAPPGLPCPSCLRASREVEVPGEFGPLTLDLCTACHVAWFDPPEWDGVPPRPPEPPRRGPTPEAAEALAAFQLDHARFIEAHREAAGEKAGAGAPPPEESWKWLPALLGMPVELGTPPLVRRPLATWLTAAVVAVVSIAAFHDLGDLAEAWGVRAGDPWRRGGLTLLTSFFLHAGWLHLLGNLYFLGVFGDDVECLLGRGRFLLLLLAATMAGGLAWAAQSPPLVTLDETLRLADPEPVAIGSSGGISGIVAFYALAFPRVRMGLLFFYVVWIRIPVLAYLLLWVALQWAGATHGDDGIAYGAHLAGAFAGFVAWLLWRYGRRGAAPPAPPPGALRSGG